MKKKLVTVGLLAGGIALTGLAGSAYAEGGAPTTKPAAPPHAGAGTGAVAGKSAVAIACVRTDKHIKGKPEKGIVSFKKDDGRPALSSAGAPPLKVRTGKALPALPRGVRATTKVIARKGGAPGDVKILPAPKGAHCYKVKPGAPLPTP
jgi:hypothetical protein